jgi:hypothetical protein
MLVKCRASNLILVGGLLLAPGVALSQDATTKPHVPLEKTIGQVRPTGPVPSLAVLNAAGAKLEGGKLILTGVAPNSIVFADRPVRAAGHVMTEQFIMQWDEGKDSFAKDPPNATVSVLGGDGSKVSDVVVTLKAPKLEGGNLSFEVVVLEGSLAGSSGPAALFIDHFGGFGGGFRADGFEGERFGGYRGGAWAGDRYWHAPVYHGAWYAGARRTAVGAAYNSYVVPDQCGYYPYSPCE